MSYSNCSIFFVVLADFYEYALMGVTHLSSVRGLCDWQRCAFEPSLLQPMGTEPDQEATYSLIICCNVHFRFASHHEWLNRCV